MRQYPRLPAFIVLAFALAAGYSYIKLSRAQTSDSAFYEDRIASRAADDEDWKNYVRALAKEGKYDRLIPAFQHCVEKKITDRSINFIYIESLGRTASQNPAYRQKLFEFLETQVQTDPKLVLDSFDRPDIAPLKSNEEFDALFKTAQKNAAD